MIMFKFAQGGRQQPPPSFTDYALCTLENGGVQHDVWIDPQSVIPEPDGFYITINKQRWKIIRRVGRITKR